MGVAPAAGDLIEAHFGRLTLVGRLLTNQEAGPCIEVPSRGRHTRVLPLKDHRYHHVFTHPCNCQETP